MKYRLVQTGTNKHDNVFFHPGFCSLEEGLSIASSYDWIGLETLVDDEWVPYESNEKK